MQLSLSDSQIRQLVGATPNDLPVYSYREILPFHRLEQLFHGSIPAVLLLYEWKPMVGHWTCILFHPETKTFEFFDPYGLKPDDEKKFIPQRFFLEQRLSQMLRDAAMEGFRIEYNEVPLQHDRDGVNTCGRWVALRILTRNIPLPIFQKLMKGPQSDHKVVQITNSLKNW